MKSPDDSPTVFQQLLNVAIGVGCVYVACYAATGRWDLKGILGSTIEQREPNTLDDLTKEQRTEVLRRWSEISPLQPENPPPNGLMSPRFDE